VPENTPHGKDSAKEEALARLAAIVQCSDDAIIGKTLDGIITSWNRGAERIYGYLAHEVVGRHISLLAPPEYADELRELMDRVRNGEHVEHLETERVTKAGRRIKVSLTLSPIFRDDGALSGISTIARDITERARLEELLRESEKRYHTQVELAPEAIVVHANGLFVYANCAALGLYGAASLQQLQQVGVLELVHPSERDQVAARNRQLLEGGEVPLRECRLLRLDGQSVPVETSSIRIDYLGIASIQVVARDISERKRIEGERETLRRELEIERARFETVLRQMPIGVLIAEAPSGRIMYSNEASNRIFRAQFPEVTGIADYGKLRLFRSDGSLVPAEQYPMARALLEGETIIGEELQIERGDGTLGFVSVNAAPICDPSGATVSGVAAFSDITEQIAARQALRQSEERLSLALDATGMGSCAMNAQTGTGIWSPQHFLILGYHPPESSAGSASMNMWQDRIHPDDLPKVKQALDAARASRSLCRSEHRIVRADDGRLVWVNVLGRFGYDQLGAAASFIGVIFDVTERKLAEQKLRDSELQHRLLFETSLQGILYLNDEERILMANPAAEKILDRSWDELQGKALTELGFQVEGEDGSAFPPAEIPCSKALTTGKEVRDVILSLRNPGNGTRRWLSINAVPLFLSEAGAQRPYQVYATFEDITPRKLAEEALRASEAKFRWIFESNLIAIFFWNKDGKITEANQSYCDLVGYSPGECREGNLNWLDSTPPEQFDRDFAAVEEIRAHGVCRPYEKDFLNRNDGRRVPVLCAGARMVGSQSEGMGFAIDLTELKRAEKAMRESEATLKLAIETTGLGTFDRDLVTGKSVWSDIAKRHYGLSPEAAVDAEIYRRGVHPEDLEQVERARREALNPAGEGRYSAKYRTVGIEDAKERWITARGQVFFSAQGEPLRFVGTCLDITEIVAAETALKDQIAERLRAVEELHQQEQMLIRQGRLAALGEMIGNIAHQWRQPLNTLALIVQELPWYFDHGQFTKEYLDANVTRAMQVINHMSKTIDGFRNFFEPSQQMLSFRVSDVLAQTVSMVEAAFNELRLRIEVQSDPEIFVTGNPNEFSQVILNIMMNAKDALLERKVEKPRLSIRLFRAGAKAILTITDNAGGVPPAIVDKIFDPYFTTKGPDKGTGIGLFMSKTIIEKHMNGTLSARNTPTGAEFRIEV
jgi:PAS domain S-box-containing protein